MSNATHTPGPWRTEGEHGTLGAANAVYAGPMRSPDKPSRRICLCCHSFSHFPSGQEDTASPDDEDRANARLIAAAPELLESLSLLLPFMAGLRDEIFDLPQAQDAIDKANAAIAKARGELP